MPRTTSVRANALRQARAAKAAREAARLAREQRIEAALTDFYEAHNRAQQTRADAARRAEAITRDAEVKAGADEQAARTALRALRELLGSHAEVAELCGLGLGTVRAMLAVTDETGDRNRRAPLTQPENARPRPHGYPSPLAAEPETAGASLGSPEGGTSRPEDQQASKSDA